MARRVAAKRDQEEQRSERRFREALYRGVVGLRTTLERQTGVLVALERSMRTVEAQTAAADAQRRDDQIAETLRRRAQQRHDELHDPKPLGRHQPGGDVMFTKTLHALRMCLVHVPEHHYERKDGRVRVACRCREAFDLPIRNFHECSCGRLYMATENSVKVIPLEEAIAA